MANRNPITIGDIIHVYNRGTRKLDIFHDELDKEYFLRALFYFNDSHSIPNIFEELKRKYSDLLEQFILPPDWEMRDQLVNIHAFVAIPNHFHLVLEEIRENGISLFMQKLGTGLTCRYNIRYKTSGDLFQGRYKYKHVARDDYLQFLGAYVQVKNVFELYTGGFENAMKSFSKAFDFASIYRYGSLSHYLGVHQTPIIAFPADKSLFFEVGKKNEYKKFAQSVLRLPDFETAFNF